MNSSLVAEVLGTLRSGVFTAAAPRMGVCLGADRFLIGSSPGPAPSLVLADGTVSRRHAEVTPGPDGWRIRDLGSDNGMFVLRRLPECSQPTAVAGLEGEYVREAAVAGLEGEYVREVRLTVLCRCGEESAPDR
jgi:hypothetical protein